MIENFFYKKVNKGSRKAMIDFLTGHFRYHTMNSWNNSTSYANNIKIHRLNLTREVADKAYDITDTEEFWCEVNEFLRDFDRAYNHSYQICSNGRSGGYFVIVRGGERESSYKSYCTECHQKNCNEATEESKQCGRCGANARVNRKFTEIYTQPGQNIDQDEDFDDWSMQDLKDRVELVQHFDKVCDEVRHHLISLATEYEVVDEEYFVTKTRKVLKEKAL